MFASEHGLLIPSPLLHKHASSLTGVSRLSHCLSPYSRASNSFRGIRSHLRSKRVSKQQFTGSTESFSPVFIKPGAASLQVCRNSSGEFVTATEDAPEYGNTETYGGKERDEKKAGDFDSSSSGESNGGVVEASNADVECSRSAVDSYNKYLLNNSTPFRDETLSSIFHGTTEEGEIACSILSQIESAMDSFAEAGVMPPWPQEGLIPDLSGFELDTILTSDVAYNKELSWLAFNWRVLYMALDKSTPLFERLRFLAITARNLDEFFCKRVGALKRQEAAGVENLIQRNDQRLHWTPKEQLKIVAREVSRMVETQVNCWLAEILPALKSEDIHIHEMGELDEKYREHLRHYFRSTLEPVLTPLAVDPGHPFPHIGNMTLNIAVALRDPLDDDLEFAIVEVPNSVPRWLAVASEEEIELDSRLQNCFVSVEEVIKANLDLLFGGMEILSAHCFRVTRNADVERNEEEADDLLEMIADEMRERRFAPFVRLEVDCEMPEEVLFKLTNELGLKNNKDDVYKICGPLAMGELDCIPADMSVNSPLQFTSWVPQAHPKFMRSPDMFEVIRGGDVMVHHPYQSFVSSTQSFVESAAKDPQVRAIKATLYRTSADSSIINALMTACEYGKQVAVLVELKARFDEARNVGFAQKLETAGCHVAYGLVGLKTHCKCIMVVREEEDGLRTYVHIGTGNYNPRTAGVYTDFGLFSCCPDLGQDVNDLFKYLTGYHRQTLYRKLLVAPGTMRGEFAKLIDNEITNAKSGLPSAIIVKCNGLDDESMVVKLYEAAMAGVRIDLIVRGMCRLRPGIKGISENIRVVSIIGRFLEHHRIFRFENAGNPRYFIGSSDWMARNLSRRVEVVTPIEDESLKKELNDILQACLTDRQQAWDLRPDGRYQLARIATSANAASANGAQFGGTSESDASDDTSVNASSTRGPAVPYLSGLDRGISRLAKKSEKVGLHQALMEQTLGKSTTVKKVSMRKKSGNTFKSVRRHQESHYDSGAHN